MQCLVVNVHSFADRNISRDAMQCDSLQIRQDSLEKRRNCETFEIANSIHTLVYRTWIVSCRQLDAV